MFNYKDAINRLAHESVKGRLSFFLGTGFSKSLVPDIPTWDELFVQLCKDLNVDSAKLTANNHTSVMIKLSLLSCVKDYEFPHDIDYYKSVRFHIKETVANCIKKNSIIKNEPPHLKSYQEAMQVINPRMIFTTNYDGIVGLPFLNSRKVVPNSEYAYVANITPIFYIHGHVDYYNDLVLFEEDYLQFNNKKDYLYHQLYCSFIENTNVFLGYSLSDQNIKQILSEIAHKERSESYQDRFLFLWDEDHVPDYEIKYFEQTFETRVVKYPVLVDFLTELSAACSKLKKLQNSKPEEIIHDLSTEEGRYRLSQSENLFGTLLNGLSKGYNQLDQNTQENIIMILEHVKATCTQTGAFSEYAHLARFLILIGQVWDVQQFPYLLKHKYLELYRYILNHSGERVGESWAAGRLIKRQFGSQTKGNIRTLREDKEICSRLEYLRIPDC